MIGIRKPSLHFYSRQIVFYEPNTEEGLINLSERLNTDRRENYEDKPDYEFKSLLIVIDQYSSLEKHGQKLIIRNWVNLGFIIYGEFKKVI